MDNDDQISIIFSTPSGHRIQLTASMTDKMRSFKRTLKEKDPSLANGGDDLVLIFHGQRLADHQTVAECGLSNESIVLVTTVENWVPTNSHGGNKIEIIFVTPTDKRIQLPASMTDKMRSFKPTLKEKDPSLANGDLVFHFNRQRLADHQTVAECGLKHKSIVFVTTDETKVLTNSHDDKNNNNNNSQSSSPWWGILAGVVVVAGAALMWLATRNNPSDEPKDPHSQRNRSDKRMLL